MVFYSPVFEAAGAGTPTVGAWEGEASDHLLTCVVSASQTY